MAFVAALVVDRKADAGTAEMETIAEARSLYSVEVDTVAVAIVGSQSGLAAVEIDARSILSLHYENTWINPATIAPTD